jgi:hypothetical protein
VVAGVVAEVAGVDGCLAGDGVVAGSLLLFGGCGLGVVLRPGVVLFALVSAVAAGWRVGVVGVFFAFQGGFLILTGTVR